MDTQQVGFFGAQPIDVSSFEVSSMHIAAGSGWPVGEDQTIRFFAPGDGPEMLRIAQDGFYVRGVKFAQDASEARAVFDGFREWLLNAQKPDRG